MAKIVVVYHSGYGHTAKQAKAVGAGVAKVAGVEVSVRSVDDLKSADGKFTFDELNAADGIIFGCPTYMGGPSAPFKAFIDAGGEPWAKHAWKDKIAAGFTNSGSPSGDKQNTLTTLWVNAMQHGMIWVGLGLHPALTASPAGAGPDELNRLGAFGGAMAASGHKTKPEEVPPPGDLKTAEHLGQRVAEAVLRWTTK